MAYNYRAIEDVIATDAQLQNLTPEQKTAISAILGARIGEIYRDFDNTIKNATGIDRNGAEKTYEYMERAGKELKAALETANGKVTTLGGEITTLKEQIAKGGDDALKQQLQQLQSDKNSLQQSYTLLKQQFDTQETQHKAELFNLRVGSEIQSAFDRITFKKDANAALVEMVKENAKNAVMGMNPSYYNNAQGKEVLIFRDKNGATLNNPDNSMNPFTAEELLRREMDKFGILGTPQKGGAGGSGGGGNPPVNGVLDLSGARTQDEAIVKADAYLREKGFQVGSKEYQDEMTKIYNENNLKDKPLI